MKINKDEYELMGRLATMLGIAGPDSQEERNSSAVYKRSTLRAAIKAVEILFGKEKPVTNISGAASGARGRNGSAVSLALSSTGANAKTISKCAVSYEQNNKRVKACRLGILE